MRVVEPHQFEAIKRAKRSFKNAPKLALILVVISIASGAWYVYAEKPSGEKELPETSSTNQFQRQSNDNDQQNEQKLRQFTGEEFKKLYQNVSYPNTQAIDVPPQITGNVAADQQIRKVAEARGYRLGVVPLAPIVRINEPMLDSDDLLQPLAVEGWKLLKKAAEKNAIPLSLSSAYRSPQYQRELFLQRLFATGVSIDQIISGSADNIIDQTLALAAIPGYSRHHTGYAIDLWCDDGSAAFLSSVCYKWISADNYKVAKESGWIPSYPDGADMQGPEPEPWEYVWVGRKSLLSNR